MESLIRAHNLAGELLDAVVDNAELIQREIENDVRSSEKEAAELKAAAEAA